MLDLAKRAFMEVIERYLSETLHGDVRIAMLACPPRLPAFLKMYNFYEIWITGIRCVVIAAEAGMVTPAQVAKHVDLVRTLLQDDVVIFATAALSAYNRSRLIAHGVAFIVPGNQLYIPELAADLRGHFRKPKKKMTDRLSPAAQAVLFHYILRINEHAERPSELAKTLHYSAMSIGRAFDDLIACGLARADKEGKERHISFQLNRRALFEKALPLLRTPVRAIKYLQNRSVVSLKWGGESALSKLTDLSSPRLEVFAVAARQWKAWLRENNLVEVEEDRADFIIETWSYDAEGLSTTSTVDPLSLYVQFRDHPDERLAIAADALLERISW